jgi:hypothetical protein
LIGRFDGRACAGVVRLDRLSSPRSHCFRV